MNAPWRQDPQLKQRFHPDYPDDLQVLVHEGGPRMTDNYPEVMWVRVEGTRGQAYVGTVLNEPRGLSTVKQGDQILFIVAAGCEYPLRVTEKYLAERPAWDVKPCDGCGLAELLDAPSDLIAKIFPNLPEGSSPEMFTSFCPICGGVQVVSAKPVQ